MKNKKIFEGINFTLVNDDKFTIEDFNKIEVPDIETDSRNIKKDFLFFAIVGSKDDGHNYLKKAIENGASAAVVSKRPEPELLNDIPVIMVKDTLKTLNRISSHFFNYPSDDMEIIGITGTNGKTTTTYFIYSVLKHAKIKAGLIGTVKYIIDDEEFEARNTTPFAIELQKILYLMRQKGDKVVVMEVSSHALNEDRTYGIFFSGVGLTNLTRDHLDYHGTMENYARVKATIFTRIRKGGYSVINLDTEYSEYFLKYIHSIYSKYITISLVDPKAALFADNIKIDSSGTSFDIHFKEETYPAKIKLLGKQNVYNALTAFALCWTQNIDINIIIEGLAELELVPGRFDVVNEGQNFMVVVDYAHSHDALKNLLTLAKELPHKRIITVFGCGGNRDKTKRPIMGQVCTELSDQVIITTDNPRSEPPASIIDDILNGIKDKKNYVVIEKREEAIKKAVEMAQEGDVVLIAGKGHENYQIIGDEKFEFNDKEIAAKYIKEKIK